jgi:hypothetical protein
VYERKRCAHGRKGTTSFYFVLVSVTRWRRSIQRFRSRFAPLVLRPRFQV